MGKCPGALPRDQLALPHHGQQCSCRYSITSGLPFLLPAASTNVRLSKRGQPFDFPHFSSSTDSTKSFTLNGNWQLTPACGMSEAFVASRQTRETREKSARSVALRFGSTCLSNTRRVFSRNCKKGDSEVEESESMFAAKKTNGKWVSESHEDVVGV